MIPITTEQLQAFKSADANVPIINVLGKKSFQQAHIPGSINIPRESANFVMDVAKLTESERSPVIVYCASASCDESEKAAKDLENVGFSKVYDFEGGIEAWKDAGLPLE